MTQSSTTIRVSVDQRERLRQLAAQRDGSMANTLDAALEALRRDQFFRAMGESESSLRADHHAWSRYLAERDLWLNAELG
ncbi:MAG: hypothetical protein HY826_07805 [Actinobacteria bacterium]|nr:hypothetical protein [Actinomycetota bacterium]